MKKIKFIALAVFFAVTAVEISAQDQVIRMFSHRGGRLEHDENTMIAFQKSWDAGYTGFEIDIRMTKDGEMVVTHDHTLERTTNGTGILEEKTAAEVRQLRTKQGNELLFLDEFLDFIKDKKGLYVEFEMKTKPVDLYPEERLKDYCDKLYKMVMEHYDPKSGSAYLFTSSDYRGLRYLQSNYPDAELLMITSKPCNNETIDLCLSMGFKRLGAKMEGTSREAVKKAKSKGLVVSLWPGLSVEDFMLGAYLGSDYMCTDVPLEVMEWAKKNTPWLNVVY